MSDVACSQGRLLDDGVWSKKAVAEARRSGSRPTFSDGDNKSIPSDVSAFDYGDANTRAQSAYLHLCANDVSGRRVQGPGLAGIGGRKGGQLQGAPSWRFSSNFCSSLERGGGHADLRRAQKERRPRGVTIVIVRKDLLGPKGGPHDAGLDGDVGEQVPAQHRLASPSTCGLVFKHLLSLGGLDKVEQINKAKRPLRLHQAEPSYYDCPVDPKWEAMNVPFTIPGHEDLEKVFVQEAEAAGLINLKGHRSVGGMRATSTTPCQCRRGETVAFMKDFRQSLRRPEPAVLTFLAPQSNHSFIHSFICLVSSRLSGSHIAPRFRRSAVVVGCVHSPPGFQLS